MTLHNDLDAVMKATTNISLGDRTMESTHGTAGEQPSDQVQAEVTLTHDTGVAESSSTEDKTPEMIAIGAISPDDGLADTSVTEIRSPIASPSKEVGPNIEVSSTVSELPGTVRADTPIALIPSATFTFDPTLTKWHIPASTYLVAHPQTSVLATGIAVYTRSTSGTDHLLVVQRASTDSYPNCWEVPGGSVDMTGETIIEAAARELKEETGLTVSRFVVELEMIKFSTGRRKWTKWWDKPTFVVEVCEAGEEAELEMVSEMVKLDEKEHQAWVWATEEDVRSCRCGEVPLVFVSKQQQNIMLEGFAMRKDIPTLLADLDRLDSLNEGTTI